MKTYTNDSGRIFKANKKPWTHEWRAKKVLNELGLSDTYVVDGHGNEGPNGRAYYLRPKFKGFIKVTFDDLSDYYPLEDDYSWVLEISEDEDPSRVEHFVWELKEFGSDWNLKYDKERNSIGFNSYTDYHLFKRAVLQQKSGFLGHS